jgi:hypothetical protein
MAGVFISFVHEDQEVAEAVQRYLHDNLPNHGVFLSSDAWQIMAGEIWLDRIKAELSDAKVVVLLLSRRSVARPWVNFEAGAAWLQGTPIVPVCYGSLNKGTLPQPYAGIQAVDLQTNEYYLLRSVAKHLGVLAPPPPPLTSVQQTADSIAGQPAGTLEQIGRQLERDRTIQGALQRFKDDE